MKGFKELDFEDVIFEQLGKSPLYVAVDDSDGVYSSTRFDRDLLADPGMLADYIKATQLATWQKLEKYYPEGPAEAVAAEIKKLRPKRGVLELLRNGFNLGGAGKVELATFKPATSFNEAHRSKYNANRFALVRQFHYSKERPGEAIDLVILLNGIPLLTMEVKNEFTGQTWLHAEAQYKKDRPAKDAFLKACVVHFAVDNNTVSMTTQLANGKTRFLPFNRETTNPAIEGNYASSYLWTEVLQADSLLDLVQNFLHWEDVKDEKGKVTGKRMIFPRYHQLDAVRQLIADAREKGSGHNYLVQHSAGSGKSNTIGWLAHLLSNLFDDQDRLIFDSVIIITDRQVLDKQLQETVKQFEKTGGLVKKIDKNTKQLLKALEDGEKIVVCTLQKFGWLQNVLGGPKGIEGKRFAIIVDEAHSSQTGEAAKDLKLALTSKEALEAIIKQDDEGYDPAKDPVADELSKIMKSRQRLPHISFFAFTATPKPKTLEVFGTAFEPFHTYTMRQAIEEGFILDVLGSYTTYSTYFELLTNDRAIPDHLVEKGKGRRLLLQHVGKHPHTIESKSKIMLDHFFANTATKIGGTAKAMVVTSSRAHAVLYFKTIKRLLKEEYGGRVQALVAFSGTVTIEGESYTEESMNPSDARDIREAFKKQKYRILVVANKFQTGFDQPLLHTMYVDKHLGGVAAVQTLCRLNRTAPLKQDPMVLDFVNEQAAIQASFQDYYGKTSLDRGTDPQRLYNMKYEIEEVKVFTQMQVDQFTDLFIAKKAKSDKVSHIFKGIVSGPFSNLVPEEQDRFRDLLRRYVNQYSFIAQVITWLDAELEKFYLFTKLLLKYIPPKRVTLPEEILDMVDMDKFRLQEEENGSILLKGEDTTMENAESDGHRARKPPELDPLAEIVKRLNEEYAVDLEELHKVSKSVQPKLAKDAGLVAAFTAADNADALRRQKFSDSLRQALLDSAGDYLSVMNRMEEKPDFKRLFEAFMLQQFKETLEGASDESHPPIR